MSTRPATSAESADRFLASVRDLRAMPALLTVAEAAEILRVGRSWIYEHAGELGAFKLGTGQTAPLRIPRDGVLRVIGMDSSQHEAGSKPAERTPATEAQAARLRPRPRP